MDIKHLARAGRELQIIKMVLAASFSWWLSVTFLNTEYPFLSPWVALLTIDATTYRTLSRGAQSVLASLLGILVAFTVGSFLGVSLWTYALALIVGLAIAQVRWIRDEGITVATMSIFILSDGFSEQQQAFSDRMLEIAVGVAVGVVVNLLVFPPLRDRQASRYVDSVNERVGSVLKNMGEEFAGSWGNDRAQSWVEETETISGELDSAWSTVKFARESRRANPRFYMYRLRQGRERKDAETTEVQATDASWEEILRRSGEGVSRLRNLSRTMRDESYDIGDWNVRFREEWAKLARDAGHAIADPDAEVESLPDRLDQLAWDMCGEDNLLNDHWPVYGSMITDLRYIVEIVDDVASSREARETSNTPE